MPRSYYNYLDQFQPLHAFSTSGTWVLGAGFIVMAGYLLMSLLKGEKAPDNPWGSSTLEWTTSSPPIHQNFETAPIVTTGPYNYQQSEDEDS